MKKKTYKKCVYYKYGQKVSVKKANACNPSFFDLSMMMKISSTNIKTSKK